MIYVEPPETWFKRDGDRFLFFPYGMFSRAYRVTENEKARVKKFLIAFVILSAIVLPVAFRNLYPTGVALIGLWGIAYALAIRYVLSGTSSEGRPSLSDSQKVFSESFSTTRIVLTSFVCAVAALVCGIIFATGVRAGDAEDLAVGGLGFVFFGALLVASLRMKHLKGVTEDS